jgi:hypothetical protein
VERIIVGTTNICENAIKVITYLKGSSKAPQMLFSYEICSPDVPPDSKATGVCNEYL